MDDMATRWAAAKLGPASVRDGKRMCVVHVEAMSGWCDELVDRFITKVVCGEPPEPDCWLWIGAKSGGGYGAFYVGGRDDRRQYRAHRVAYEMFVGPVPDGLCVCHHCDTPACVNPAHLFLGTPGDNNADRHRKGRDGSNPVRGEDHPHAKLTADVVREMRALHASGVPAAHVAERYGLSKNHAWEVCTKRSWTHV